MKATRKPQSQSGVTTGRRLWLDRIDQRTGPARRWRDLHAAYAAAVPEPMTPGQDALVRRAASLAVASEQVDAQLARGEPIDHDMLVRLTGSLTRTLEALGLAPKPAAPEQADSDPRARLRQHLAHMEHADDND